MSDVTVEVRRLHSDNVGLTSTKAEKGLLRPPSGCRLTVVVGADLECLVTSHQDTDLAGLLVLEQSDVACSTLFPLLGLPLESEELCTPAYREQPTQLIWSDG